MDGNYWSGTEYGGDVQGLPPGYNAWCFHSDNGAQGYLGKASPLYAWAVRDGDVVPYLSCAGFEPPCDSPDVALTVKKNKCIPLKTELIDENDISITDTDIEYPPVLVLVNFAGSAMPSEVVAVDGLPPSKATDGNQFEFIGGRWCFNLKVKDYYTAPGTYTFELRTGSQEEYIIEPTGTVKIVVEK